MFQFTSLVNCIAIKGISNNRPVAIAIHKKTLFRIEYFVPKEDFDKNEVYNTLASFSCDEKRKLVDKSSSELELIRSNNYQFDIPILLICNISFGKCHKTTWHEHVMEVPIIIEATIIESNYNP